MTYNTKLGVFLERDPLPAVAPNLANGANLYEYAVSSPTNYTDWSGLKVNLVEPKKDSNPDYDKQMKVYNTAVKVLKNALDADKAAYLKKYNDKGLDDEERSGAYLSYLAVGLLSWAQETKNLTVDVRFDLKIKSLNGLTSSGDKDVSIFQSIKKDKKAQISLNCILADKNQSEIATTIYHEFLHLFFAAKLAGAATDSTKVLDMMWDRVMTFTWLDDPNMRIAQRPKDEQEIIDKVIKDKMVPQKGDDYQQDKFTWIMTNGFERPVSEIAKEIGDYYYGQVFKTDNQTTQPTQPASAPSNK